MIIYFSKALLNPLPPDLLQIMKKPFKQYCKKYNKLWHPDYNLRQKVIPNYSIFIAN